MSEEKKLKFSKRREIQEGRVKDFEKEIGILDEALDNKQVLQDATVLSNPTDEDKEIKWDGNPYIIKAGEKKPFPNYIVRNFLKHTMGLELASDTTKPEPKEEPKGEPVKIEIKSEEKKEVQPEPKKLSKK